MFFNVPSNSGRFSETLCLIKILLWKVKKVSYKPDAFINHELTASKEGEISSGLVVLILQTALLCLNLNTKLANLIPFLCTERTSFHHIEFICTVALSPETRNALFYLNINKGREKPCPSYIYSVGMNRWKWCHARSREYLVENLEFDSYVWWNFQITFKSRS